MKTLALRGRDQAGYNLVGISLFMVVLGILIVGGLGLKQKYDWAKRQEVTVANTAIIKTAMKQYQARNGVLPCPASLTESPSSANFGKATDCSAGTVAGTFQDTGRGGRSIRYGAVPVRTLGLPDEVLVDGWDHRYVYAVTEYYTVGEPDPNFDYGAIRVRDGNNANMTKNSGNVIYAVMSPGADERGAYSKDGNLISPCDTLGTNCIASSGDGRLQVAINRQYNTQTDAGNNDFTATMTYEASAKSYEWRVTNWQGACTCANPVRTRTATCYERGTDTIRNGRCSESDRPAETQSCADFCWGPIDPFPSCPGGCGQPPSTVTRDPPDCLENNARDVPDSLCIEDKGPHGYALSQSCPGTGSCNSSSGGGGYADTDGDGRGDTYIGSSCGNHGASCSDSRGQDVIQGGGQSGSDDGRGPGHNR